MQRALIIGCGYTGTALAQRLADSGVAVVGTTAGSRSAPAVVGMRQLDLLSGEPELPEATDAVVYYMVSTLYRDYDADERPHLEPLRRCLEALERVPVCGLVYLSSTSVYGDRRGDWVDEESPVAPRSPWGKMRVELEQAAWAFGDRRSVPACVVRLPEIYGPGRGPQERLRRDQVVLRNPEAYSNRIHIDDLVTVLVTLGRRLEPRLLLAADDAPTPRGEIYRYASEALGCAPPDLDRTTTELGDANRRALRDESKRCSNALLRRWLGQPLRYPTYQEGIKAILAAD